MELSSLLEQKPSLPVSAPQPLLPPPHSPLETSAGAFHRHEQQPHVGAPVASYTSKSFQPREMASASPTDSSYAIFGRHAVDGQSPVRPPPAKHVSFELLFEESPEYKARLPLRVQIFPHDSTESIVTTVKNFYGLYAGPNGISKGVSFEDSQGHTLIAGFENFCNNMVVYVRVTEGSPQPAQPTASNALLPAPLSAQSYNNGGYPAQPVHPFGLQAPRPASPGIRKRSPSADGRGRSSDSLEDTASKKGRSRSSKTRAAGHENHSDGMNGYSSGDNAPGSVSSRAKDQLGNTDISVENIVEGGRRKRAKFESSELPLFAPPQMPAATSNPSVSPARRPEHQRPSLPFTHHGPNPFTNARVIQSPQSYGNGYNFVGAFATPVADSRRHRGSVGYPHGGQGILPTPDPTVGSAMSEEDKDVAIQLMRLGEMSNMSHGRTSASTLDETFSGVADATSSTGATSEGESEEEELPPARRQKLSLSAAGRNIYEAPANQFMQGPGYGDASGDDADSEDVMEDGVGGAKQTDVQPTSMGPSGASSILNHKTRLPSLKTAKLNKPSKSIKPGAAKKATGLPGGPMSPNSLPAQSRKPSVVSAGGVSGLGADDGPPDLSTKPRCQRCRKSKKGCDRDRPCGRCKDAGLSADQCVSEDEGNGRKGRYGRHMGVPLGHADAQAPPTLLPAAPIGMPMTLAMGDKNKKRKR